MLLLLFTLSFQQLTQAQTVEICMDVKVETVEQCEKAEACIQKLCGFVLKKPMMSNDKVVEARGLILEWMNVTMNYGFTLDKHIMNLCRGENTLLLGVYMVSMAQGAFKDRKHQDYEGLQILVDYIEDKENNVQKTRAVKKFLKNWKKKKIKKYIHRGEIPVKQ